MLAHRLTRNDPWASQMYCNDQSCATCDTRQISEGGEEKGHEGRGASSLTSCNSLQAPCATGKDVTMSSSVWDASGWALIASIGGNHPKSSRQRQGQHQADLRTGVPDSPLVQHVVEVHGGEKATLPKYYL